jgi:SAM-dependent methyltransferase
LRLANETEALLVTFTQAADLYRRAMLSQFHTKTAQDWDRANISYRTKRFQEIVSGIAEKMNRPIIAELGCSDGLLSYPLQKIAKKIYCVDNAPGIIAEVDSNEVMQPILADVTDSGLQNDSIDLVICSRIIEYLLDPDDLAEEIKRIGKTGAEYFVTFPALHDNLSPRRSQDRRRYLRPDDRIRRHFSENEIRKWASQIGPGRLIGIQYEEPEPTSPETEQRYRSIENAQPNERAPTNWVFAGTIQNKSLRKIRKAIPLSAFEFRSQPSAKEYIITVGLRFPKSIRRVRKWILRI